MVAQSNKDEAEGETVALSLETFQSFFIQSLIKVSHSLFFSLEVAETQACRIEF